MSSASETSPSKIGLFLPTLGPQMTRCECAGLDFAEIATRAKAGGKSPEAVMAEAGVGGTCTSCTQDLHSFLERQAKSPE